MLIKRIILYIIYVKAVYKKAQTFIFICITSAIIAGVLLLPPPGNRLGFSF